VEQSEEFLAGEYRRIRRTGYVLAGGLDDLEGRAAVYLGLYQASGGRNVFPLIAAHGALWARGYLAKGMFAGRSLALLNAFEPRKLRERLVQVRAFSDAFRDINRRVCAEAYGAYHFTKEYGGTAYARSVLPAGLLGLLNACHRSQAEGTTFSAQQRRQLFAACFLWEQSTIASPAVEAAMARFDWPLARWFAMRPCIRFAYFSARQYLHFRDFSSEQERVLHGASAYEFAEKTGFAQVEMALRRRGIAARHEPAHIRVVRAGAGRARPVPGIRTRADAAR
jgi:hypothetical protein